MSTIRTTQERIKLLDVVIDVQEDVLNFIEERVKAGVKAATEIDRAQARSNLEQSRAQREQFDTRSADGGKPALHFAGHAGDRSDAILARLRRRSIPIAPEYVVVGIPADLLRRRPDVRRAERTGRGTSGRDRHRGDGLVSGDYGHRHLGLAGAEFVAVVHAGFVQQLGGAVVPMESVELRAESQQRPIPRCAVPRAWSWPIRDSVLQADWKLKMAS